MTKDPVTIGPDETLKDVARLLGSRGISGLPVVGIENEPLGVVSEADILAKEAGPEGERGFLGWLLGGRADPGASAKLGARTAGEAMSSPAITIRPERSVAEAARTMIGRRVNRLPVVDGEGRLVGIVTRADLIRAFARPDDEIRREIEDDLLLRALWVAPGRVAVDVSHGEVTLRGRVETELNAQLLPKLVERVPGVVSVTSTLTWDTD
jgi:CBS domain-containing protein